MYDPSNFRGSQLKFKARVGWLGLETNPHKRQLNGGICQKCDTGSTETIQHMLLSCPALNTTQCIMFSGLAADLGDHTWSMFLNADNRTKIDLLLGDLTDHKIGDAFDQHPKLFLKTVFSY